MAKTLKDFLEGYLKVKSADEQKFIDKHVTVKNPDRNGNGDDVFKGSTKAIDRRKERKGYNPGEDEKVYEALKGNQHKIDANKNGKVDAHDFKLLRKKKGVKEEVEELEELSTDTKDSYAKKAVKQLPGLSKKSGETADDARKYYNRKNTVRKIANEEVELEEKLDMKKASMGTVVKDFQKSDAPQFKGKSAKKRQVMAIAAKLTAERGGKPLRKEERLQKQLTDISESHQRIMLEVFEKLNEDNKSKFMEACTTPEGVEQMLDFAIRHRGE
jgi:hypothetical protein